MTTLKSSLENLIINILPECSIVERATGGYKLVFEHLIPETYLVHLLAFCTLHNYSYYISARDNNIEFQIYE